MKWLFLVHQMQTLNSRERVKVWRPTKKVGAVFYRNSVYVFPYSKEQLEDFQWLCQQIKDSKGEASVFVSEPQMKMKTEPFAASLSAVEKKITQLFLHRQKIYWNAFAARSNKNSSLGQF